MVSSVKATHARTLRCTRAALTVVCLCIAALTSVAKDVPSDTVTLGSPLEVYARLQTLNAEILGGRSATAVLEKWCRDHDLADDPKIVAVRVGTEPNPPTSDQMRRLGVKSADEVSHRRVSLRCGQVEMSRADNWYVPARLTSAMNAQLAETDTPFGKVVASLEPSRQTIESVMLWTPERLCECGTNARMLTDRDVPAEIFRHRAVLYTRDRQPFSEVSEVYQGASLIFSRTECDDLSAHSVGESVANGPEHH